VRVEAAKIFTRFGERDLGFRFLLDSRQRTLLAMRWDKLVVDLPFPKPTSILFLHGLSFRDTLQISQLRDHGVRI
jgi:hypothetical protein